MSDSASAPDSPDRPSDHELMDQAKKGDQNAFRILYDRHGDALYRYAMRLTGREQVARDVVQEVFFYLFQKLEEYEPRAKLTTLLWKVTRNTSIDHMRKLRKEKNVDLDLDRTRESDPLTSDPYEQMTSREVEQQVLNAIRSLPEAYHRTLELRLFEQFQYSEIADILEVPVGTVRSRIHNGLNKLRDNLRNRFSDVFEPRSTAEAPEEG